MKGAGQSNSKRQALDDDNNRNRVTFNYTFQLIAAPEHAAIRERLYKSMMSVLELLYGKALHANKIDPAHAEKKKSSEQVKSSVSDKVIKVQQCYNVTMLQDTLKDAKYLIERCKDAAEFKRVQEKDGIDERRQLPIKTDSYICRLCDKAFQYATTKQRHQYGVANHQISHGKL